MTHKCEEGHLNYQKYTRIYIYFKIRGSTCDGRIRGERRGPRGGRVVSGRARCQDSSIDMARNLKKKNKFDYSPSDWLLSDSLISNEVTRCRVSISHPDWMAEPFNNDDPTLFDLPDDIFSILIPLCEPPVLLVLLFASTRLSALTRRFDLPLGSQRTIFKAHHSQNIVQAIIILIY